MLHDKDINKIWELKNDFTHRWLKPDYILSSLKCFSFSTVSKSLNPLKQKGYSFESIFSCLICLPFIGIRTVHSLTDSVFAQHIQAHKDAFYRLKNNLSVNWRDILWMFSLKALNACNEDGSKDSARVRCLIFDDSALPKTGRYIEKVSRVWDHVSNRCILGFKLLVIGYWDGSSFIPLDFSLHRERGKNAEKPFGLKKKEYRKQYRQKREPGMPSYERAKDTDISKIESAIKMFWRAISRGVKVDYVLMDSWFTCEAFINAVRKVKTQYVHLIGMYKTAKTKFLIGGKQLTVKEICNNLGKPRRCRKLKLHYKEIVVGMNGDLVKLFFSRQGKNGKWKVFICTDTDLSFIRMIEIYQIRWTIEVFFKESKQLLGLGQCQSNDFSAQIADTTITLIRHILLTLKYRFEHYESKGALFVQIEENVMQCRLNERLWGLFIELLQIIGRLFEGVDEMAILEKVIADEESYQMISRLFQCKSEMENAA